MRQLIEATPWDTKPHHLLRDGDAVYGRELRQRARRIGIDAIATPMHAPKATAFGFSRETFYQALRSFEERGMAGLQDDNLVGGTGSS